MRIGYARVSTAVQLEGYSLEQQKAKLLEAGCEKVYSDVMSGAKKSRPGLDSLMDVLREGDVVVVCKLDRLGRSLSDLNSLLDSFKSLGVEFVSLAESIDTGSITGRLMFNVLGSIAEFERELIMERTRAGIDEAKRNGVKFGRPKMTDSRMVRKAVKLYQNPALSAKDAAAVLGVSRGTFYRLLDEAKALGLLEG